jgi:hypothetical protein
MQSPCVCRFDAALLFKDSRVVDQSDQSAESVAFFKQSNDVGFNTHVRAYSEGHPSQFLDVTNDACGGLIVSEIVHAHRISTLRREPRGCRSDAAACARNEQHAVHVGSPVVWTAGSSASGKFRSRSEQR